MKKIAQFPPVLEFVWFKRENSLCIIFRLTQPVPLLLFTITSSFILVLITYGYQKVSH